MTTCRFERKTLPFTILLMVLLCLLPACSGVALGLDRLLMLLCDAADIREVLMFPWDRI